MQKYIFTFLIFILSQSVFSQVYYEPAYGTVYILVKDKDKKPVASVNIWLENVDSNLKFEAVTNQKGKAELRVRRNFKYTINLPGALKIDEMFVPDINQGLLTKTIIYEPPASLAQDGEYDTIRKEITVKDKPTMSTARVELTLVDQYENPVVGLQVIVRNENFKRVYVDETDYDGRVIYMVPIKQHYYVDIETIKGFKEFKIGKYGGLIDKRTFIYVPTEIQELMKNDTIFQILPENPQPTVLRAYVNILVLDEYGNPMHNEAVCLNKISNDSMVYLGRTDINGRVGFYLPKGFEYVLHFQYERNIDILDFREKMTLHQKDIEYTYFPPPPHIASHLFVPELEYVHFDDYRNYKKKDISYDFDSEVKIEQTFSQQVINEGIDEMVVSIAWYSKANNIVSKTPPLNICLVVDNSGSMSGEKMEYVKSALEKYINKLRDQDVVSLVSFSGNSEVLVEPILIKEGKAKLLKAIEDIEILGATNILEGLETGYKELEKVYDESKINRLVLLTDGYGMNEANDVIKMSKTYNLKGLECSTIGVGYDFHQYLLSELAKFGNGVSHVIRESKDIEDGYFNDLMNLLSPVGKNVKMEIEYPDYLTLKNVFGYDFTNSGQNKVTVKLPNLYGESNNLMLLKFSIDHKTLNEKSIPIISTLIYEDVNSNHIIENMNYSEVIVKKKEEAKFKDFDDDLLKKQYLIAIMGDAMHQMVVFYENEKYGKAIAAIDDALKEVKKFTPTFRDKDVMRLVDELYNYRRTLQENIKAKK